MKGFKTVFIILIIASASLSVTTIIDFARSQAIGIWQILLLSLVAAIPVVLAVWALLRKENDLLKRRKVFLWVLTILTIGVIVMSVLSQLRN